MPENRVLITGATGFFARHILGQLQDEAQASPVALVRSLETWQQYDWTDELDDVTVVEGSITETDHWSQDSSITNVACIVHLAAEVRHSRQAPESMYRTNIDGTLNMVRLAAQVNARLILLSSSGTVGCFENSHEWADESGPYRQDTVGDWPYYDSKIKAEIAARKLAKELGVELVIVRPPILLGPDDHKLRSSTHVIRHLRRSNPFMIQGGIHFVDVRDAAAAIVQAIEHSAPRPIYHLSGTAITLPTLFSMLELVSGVPKPKLTIPHSVALGAARIGNLFSSWLPIDVKSPLPDPVVIEMGKYHWDVRSRYAAADLGFQNRAAIDTLTDTVAWLRSQQVA